LKALAKDTSTQLDLLRDLPRQFQQIYHTTGTFSVSEEAQQQLKGLLNLTKPAGESAVRYKILEALKFVDLHVRYSKVEAAHDETFRWIVEDSSPSETPLLCEPREQYLSWLSKGQGIFHVIGKPGSGKSTLMKFLYKHPRTKDELLKWSGM